MNRSILGLQELQALQEMPGLRDTRPQRILPGHAEGCGQVLIPCGANRQQFQTAGSRDDTPATTLQISPEHSRLELLLINVSQVEHECLVEDGIETARLNRSGILLPKSFHVNDRV